MCTPDHYDVDYAINPWMKGTFTNHPAVNIEQTVVMNKVSEDLKQRLTSVGYKVSSKMTQTLMIALTRDP